jgi:hypothetical protein
VRCGEGLKRVRRPRRNPADFVGGNHICNVVRVRAVQAAVCRDRIENGRERLEACRVVVISAKRIARPQHKLLNFMNGQAVPADLAVRGEEVFTTTQAIMIEHEGAVHVEEERLKLIDESHGVLVGRFSVWCLKNMNIVDFDAVATCRSFEHRQLKGQVRASFLSGKQGNYH